MRMTTTSILMALTLVAGMSAANAQIASKQYVDDRDNITIYGTNSPDSNDVAIIEENGGVKGYVDEGFSLLQDDFGELQTVVGDSNGGLVKSVTDIGTALGDAVSVNQTNGGFLFSDQGTVQTVSGNFIDDYLIADEGISLSKLILPDLPAACSATGGSCSLIYVGGTGFVWEVLARDTNESAPTDGSVSGEPLDNAVNPDFNPVDTVGSPINSCSGNADCSGGQVCISGVCRDDPNAGR